MANKSLTFVTKAPNVATLLPPPVEASKDGYVKVRLCYLTCAPKHIRNIALSAGYGIKPPYNEDVCILMPAEKVFNNFEVYLDTFEMLKRCGVIHSSDILIDAVILVEDDLTFSYVIE